MTESNLISSALKTLRKAMIHDMRQSDLTFEGLAQKTNVNASDVKAIVTRKANAVSTQSLMNLVEHYAKEWESTRLVLMSWHQTLNRDRVWIGYLLYDNETYS